MWLIRTTKKLSYRVPCEQWFLQVICSPTKGEKPLRATVCFAIEHARSHDDYVKKSNGIGFRQRELSQNNRFNKQNNNFARASRFSVHFFADYDVKMPNFVILSLGIQLQLG